MRTEPAATEKCRSAHHIAIAMPADIDRVESAADEKCRFALWQMRMPSESAAAGRYRFHSVEFEICRHEPGTSEGEFFPRQRKGTELVQRQPKMRSGKAAKAAKVA